MTAKLITKSIINANLQSLSGYLQSHGGGLKLVSWQVATGLVTVRLLGACSNCGLRHLTVKMWLEKELIKKIPQVKQVVILENEIKT